MDKLFLLAEERQREIESLCDGRFPGFGYACLSQLIALEGGRFNVALTTNFDDLIPDALYFFTQIRPLVIHHESLASFIRPTRTRPLVVKLHGDHRLSPQNTRQETAAVKEEIESQVRSILHDRGLILVGCGGNDVGIKKMLEGLSDEALPLGVFWVSAKEPECALRPWLESRDAFWVEKGDFDELMLLIRDVFELPHTETKRFDEVFEKYKSTCENLCGRIASLSDEAPDAKALKVAVERADDSLPELWSLLVSADRVEKTNADQAEQFYVTALTRFPNSSIILGSYANYLRTVRKDFERAEKYYQRALEADPKGAINLGNYATFLETVRKDYDRADEYFHHALEADPKHANNLSNYASFLNVVRKDNDQAEIYYRRALQADSEDSDKVGNYATFLYTARKAYDEAENYYRRALEANPKSARQMANYSGFLLARGRNTEGLELLEEALRLLEAAGTSSDLAESWFYAFAHRPPQTRNAALKNLKRALMAGARSPGWDFSANIVRAREGGHPDLNWLEKLAAVISNGADIADLNEWQAWNEA